MELKNDKVIIRSIQEEDLYILWKISYHDDLEWMNWNGPYFHDPIYTWKEFEEMAKKYYVEHPLKAVLLYGGEIVGMLSAGFEDSDLKHWLEFGICIYRSTTWGKGMGYIACELWISYLFDSYPYIKRIGCTTWSGNIRMIKLAEKLSLKLEGRIRKVRYYQNQYWDSMKYGVLREEWAQKEGCIKQKQVVE